MQKNSFFRYIFSLLILITNFSIEYVYNRINVLFKASAKLVSEVKSKDINKHILEQPAVRNNHVTMYVRHAC